MIKAVFFDLDNTLYDQMQFFEGAFGKIDEFVLKKFGKHGAKRALLKKLAATSPYYKFFFDDLVKELQIEDVEAVKKIVKIYRNIDLELRPWKNTEKVLAELKKNKRLGVITNGRKEMQLKKIKKLGLEKYFEKVYCSEEFEGGEKPSEVMFKKALDDFKLKPQSAAYVGDDPLRDFLAPNTLGMKTIRLLKGFFKDLKVEGERNAKKEIYSLEELPNALK